MLDLGLRVLLQELQVGGVIHCLIWNIIHPIK